MIGATIRKDTRRLQQVSREFPRLVEDMLDATALHGEAIVKQSFGSGVSSPGNPPGVDTGNLRASIHVERRGRNARAITTSAEYAHHLEFGTMFMAARPFMLPMALKLRDAIPSLWRNFLI